MILDSNQDVEMNTPLTDEMICGFKNYFSLLFNQDFEYANAGRDFQIYSHDYSFIITASFIQSGVRKDTLKERLDTVFDGEAVIPFQQYILKGENEKQGQERKYNIDKID